MRENKSHLLIYILEFLLIGGGFALLLSVQMTFYQQLIILMGVLLLYITIGLFHHRLHHDIKSKVVLEYILISVLVATLFVFLNISRL